VIFTAPILAACMPYAGERVPIYVEALNHAMLEFSIDTLQRQACFLAQLAHESGSLRFTTEIWGPTPAQAGYEGRADLGNNQPGDGKRYLGRGLIQITGRTNTSMCLAGLGRNEDDLAYLETPMGACRSAAWFWRTHGLNELADLGNFGSITKKINGGLNGLDDRIKHYLKCRKALGL
jgi:putative chitinase